MQKLQGVSKKFLVVERRPSPRILVIDNGAREDRTNIGTGWIGDPEAFRAFSRVYQSEALQPITDAGQRFVLSMAQLVVMEDVESVGGYMVRVTGSRDKPFRFGADPGRVLPDGMGASVTSRSGQSIGLHLSLTEWADTTSHLRLPITGKSPTYSALVHYVPESGTAWLHTHQEPWRDPERLTVRSIAELVEAAQAEHNQILDREIAQYVEDRYLGR